MSAEKLHPAEHRGLRELYAMTRALVSHWGRLGNRLGGDEAGVLAAGVEDARTLLAELADITAEHDLHGYPAAQGAGLNIARVRNAPGDLMLERNQALRAAVLDVQHVVTLLGYLAGLAERREDVSLTAFLRRWERELKVHEDAARAAAVGQSVIPIAPSSPQNRPRPAVSGMR